MRLAILFSIPFLLLADHPSPDAIQKWQARKFGMFIHFGLYSALGGVWHGQPVTRGYSEQIRRFIPASREEYAAEAASFNPAKWDPDAVAQLAKAAGMKFIVLTAKHHDGFNMFATRLSPFNIAEATPYRRDIVKGLADACARHGLRFGVYYSTIDWNDPRANGPSVPPTRENDDLIPKSHEDFNVAQLEELMTGYGPLSEIWFDMGQPTPEQSRRFADTVHRHQPDCMVSGRVFNEQGDFTVMGDNRIPTDIIDEPWQTPGSIYHQTWGYRSWQSRIDLSGKIREHILKLTQVVSRGGNYLLNIGPKGDGSVVDFEADVLRGIGEWLRLNAEAIYDSQPQPFRQLDFGYATVKPGRLYLLVSDFPLDGRLVLPGLRTPIRRAWFLADPTRTPLRIDGNTVIAGNPRETPPVTVIAVELGGPLRVIPPTIQPDANGVITLDAKAASRFYKYNGRGYYDPPKVSKMRWDFAVQRAGVYAIEESSTGMTIGGKPVTGSTVSLEPTESTSLVVTTEILRIVLRPAR